ncbi:MAG: rhodanese-like domain-containing protein [Bacteroidetes bacterium]|nr:rhodanese-like domain-containing protein [Bacteroidota bacterium]
MKKVSLFLIGLLLVPSLFLTSCDRGDDLSDDTGTTTPAYTILKDYMLTNNLDLDKIIVNADGAKFVAGAPEEADLAAFLDKYYIIDIRNATDFGTSHIEGAKNVPFANILDEAPIAGGAPILVVCYTGQTACYATALLRLSGYSNTQALKWGMSGWNSATADSWNNAIGDPADGHANWAYADATAAPVFGDPDISSFLTEGEELLNDRIEQVIAEGFKGVSGAEVLDSPNDYYMNNYFVSADYTGFGHIVDAYRVKEELLLATNGYQGLDPEANAVITYCYTGQTSAVITAWLRVLGYEAYSLKFGMNGLYNSNPAWVSNQWSPSVSKNLPLVN